MKDYRDEYAGMATTNIKRARRRSNAETPRNKTPRSAPSAPRVTKYPTTDVAALTPGATAGCASTKLSAGVRLFAASAPVRGTSDGCHPASDHLVGNDNDHFETTKDFREHALCRIKWTTAVMIPSILAGVPGVTGRRPHNATRRIARRGTLAGRL